MSLVQTEQILVVPTSLFHELGHFQGFSRETQPYLDELLSFKHTSYRPRDLMEEDPSFKQLIPYVIFQHVERGQLTVFCYTRGKGQGEKRLHAKRSIGIGGHISSIDGTGRNGLNPYQEGMQRELQEEVIINTPYRQRLVGMINDDETEVGKVHLGIVHIFDVEMPCVEPREDEIGDASFRPARELLREIEAFESWSQICLTALYGEE